MAPPKLTKDQQKLADENKRDDLVKRARKLAKDVPAKATKAELAVLITEAERAGDSETAADLEATNEAAAEAAEARHDGDVEAVGEGSQDPDATTKSQPDLADEAALEQARQSASAGEDDDSEDDGEGEDDEPDESADLEARSKADLQALASDLGVEGRSTMTKPELVEAIRLRQRASRSVEAAEELADRVAHPPRTEGNNPEAELHNRVVDRDDTTRESGAVVTADGVAAAIAVVEQSPTVDTMPDARRPGADEDTARVRNRRRRDDQVADSTPVTFRYIGTRRSIADREVSVPDPSPTYDRLSASPYWELAD